ncbi:MAG: hypothetical protein ABJK59_06465 [Erythrobacter sp.]|uniref:hypothetical protein n=1 Tax=Erythrobacter sp. TaxID=1042 RepID=UPI0032996EAA
MITPLEHDVSVRAEGNIKKRHKSRRTGLTDQLGIFIAFDHNFLRRTPIDGHFYPVTSRRQVKRDGSIMLDLSQTLSIDSHCICAEPVSVETSMPPNRD